MSYTGKRLLAFGLCFNFVFKHLIINFLNIKINFMFEAAIF
jgi:hypothetical protein